MDNTTTRVVEPADNVTLRLQVMISRSGICSRRSAATLIQEGNVKVNNQVITVAGYRVDPNKDTVQVKGKPCFLTDDSAYFMMNKPIRVESTNQPHSANDGFTKAKRTVKDIIANYYAEHIFSVGRLDYHSSGLLLFTTDGELCNRITHPKYQIEKKYLLETKHEISDAILKSWLEGITINGVRYTLCKYYKFPQDNTVVELILKEGKNREIRNICERYNILVNRLHRISCGPLSLGTLRTGLARPLTRREIKLLYTSVKLPLPNYC